MVSAGSPDRFDSLSLFAVTGKGGVGKSVVAAAIGRLLASRGRRTLLVEVDPRENLHQLLDVDPSGGGTVRAGENLWLQHIEPRTVIDELVRERLKVGFLVRRVLSSPIHRHFTEGAPGLKEAAVFGRILRMLEGHVERGTPRPDVVVLDAPATGHGVTWLDAPRLVSEVVSTGPVGQMASDITAFLADPDRFGSVLVTAAEEMPVTESLELLEVLRSRFDHGSELVVVNLLYPAVPADHPGPRTPAETLWFERRRINDEQLARLYAAYDGPSVHVPLLPLDPSPALVQEVADRLLPGSDGARR